MVYNYLVISLYSSGLEAYSMPPSLAGALKLPEGMSQLTGSEWAMAMTIHVSLLSGSSVSLRVGPQSFSNVEAT